MTSMRVVTTAPRQNASVLCVITLKTFIYTREKDLPDPRVYCIVWAANRLCVIDEKDTFFCDTLCVYFEELVAAVMINI